MFQRVILLLFKSISACIVLTIIVSFFYHPSWRLYSAVPDPNSNNRTCYLDIQIKSGAIHYDHGGVAYTHSAGFKIVSHIFEKVLPNIPGIRTNWTCGFVSAHTTQPVIIPIWILLLVFGSYPVFASLKKYINHTRRIFMITVSLSMLTILVWITSTFRTIGGSQVSYGVVVSNGVVNLVVNDAVATQRKLHSSWIWTDRNKGLSSIGYYSDSVFQFDGTQVFCLPLWLPLVVMSVLLVSLLWHNYKRHPTGHCSQCGYNLTGNVSGICPECGIFLSRYLELPHISMTKPG